MAYEIPRVSCRLVLKEEETKYIDDKLDNAEAAIELVGPLLKEMDRECFAVVNLDVGLRPINWGVVSIGGTAFAPVEISNVFKAAILSNASKIMVFHNHPSGNTEPSKEDIDVTNRISKAGEVLGISLIDHIIISGNKHYSISRNGQI